MPEHVENENIVLLDLENGEIREGGIVVDEERALRSPCHGYDLGDSGRLVFSEGIVGALDKYEREKYCKVGLDLKPPPPRLATRIKALREAGVHFKKKPKSFERTEHVA